MVENALYSAPERTPDVVPRLWRKKSTLSMEKVGGLGVQGQTQSTPLQMFPITNRKAKPVNVGDTIFFEVLDKTMLTYLGSTY